MYLIDKCFCCGSKELTLYPALVSPFLASYVLHRTSDECELAECRQCGCRFFTLRLTDSEAGVLYSDYRGEAYLRARHGVEFWYTEAFNNAGLDPAVIEGRTRIIESQLAAHIDVSTLQDVLDFGGDRGQTIPAAVGRTKFVYDLSGVEPVPGVSRIADVTELNARKFDLVLLNAVLEHCSEPSQVLAQLRPLARSGQSLFYVEVPFERPNLTCVGRSNLYRGYLRTLARWQRALLLVDFCSSALRVRLGFVPPLGFVKLHEHINFFSQEALRSLMTSNGFKVLSCERASFAMQKMGRTEVLACVATLA